MKGSLLNHPPKDLDLMKTHLILLFSCSCGGCILATGLVLVAVLQQMCMTENRAGSLGAIMG